MISDLVDIAGSPGRAIESLQLDSELDPNSQQPTFVETRSF